LRHDHGEPDLVRESGRVVDEGLDLELVAAAVGAGEGVADDREADDVRTERFLGGDRRRIDDVDSRRRREAVVAAADRTEADTGEATRMRIDETRRSALIRIVGVAVRVDEGKGLPPLAR